MAATGDLEIRLTDMTGQMVPGITVDLVPVSGEPGTGGAPRVVKAGEVQDLTIMGIPCREGPGTIYKVIASAPHYRRYAFFQLIKTRKNVAGDEVEFWVKPGDVKRIAAPSFAALPSRAKAMLRASSPGTRTPIFR